MKGVKKYFFWSDKTGRGFTNIFTLKALQKAFVGEKNYDGRAASSWADFAEVGDTWENAASKITMISAGQIGHDHLHHGAPC